MAKQTLTDIDLLKHYQRTSDMSYLGTLYQRYTDLVYGVCYKYLQDTGKAEDAVMGIFEHLAEKLKKAEAPDSFKAWLYVVVKNFCLTELRKKTPVVVADSEPSLMQISDYMHPMEETEQKETLLKAMEACLETLNEQQKTCIRLFYWEDLSYKHIADSLGETLGTIRSHIQNGRRNIRVCMEK